MNERCHSEITMNMIEGGIYGRDLQMIGSRYGVFILNCRKNDNENKLIRHDSCKTSIFELSFNTYYHSSDS